MTHEAHALKQIGDIASRELAEPSGNDTKALIEICTIAEAVALSGTPRQEDQIAALREALAKIDDALSLNDFSVLEMYPSDYPANVDSLLTDTEQAAADYEQRIRADERKRVAAELNGTDYDQMNAWVCKTLAEAPE